MEIILLFSTVLLTAVTVFWLWKCYHLKQDIYDFTRRLDGSLNNLLNDEKLDSIPYQKDDLWGMVYEKFASPVSYVLPQK